MPKKNPLSSNTLENSKPGTPKKYIPFSRNDSDAIENAYQTLLGQNENKGLQNGIHDRERAANDECQSPKGPKAIGQCSNATGNTGLKVPVSEDYLFDVDVDKRELLPAYWLGPVYDVRRGSWFYVGK